MRKSSHIFIWFHINRAAFFHGQVEQPVRGLMSLFQQKDIPVLIAINEKGIYVIDHVESVSFQDDLSFFSFSSQTHRTQSWADTRSDFFFFIIA